MNEFRGHSVRVAADVWQSEKKLAELMDSLCELSCGAGQVALFTAGYHPPMTVENITDCARKLAPAMDYIRSRGFKAGINLIATIGHHEENLHAAYQGKHDHMTDRNGNPTMGSYCMNDVTYLRDYVAVIYRLLAESGPDFIWIDDDVRLYHGPVGLCCYCDGCIEKFNRTNGTAYTREGLVAALDADEGDVRLRWLEHNTQAICGLMETIGSTVRKVDDRILLGYMTGERYAEGYAFERIAEVLSEGGRYPIMWRPGGGAYTDYNFDLIVKKGEELARQNVYLPPYVFSRQSEIENFPYQLIKKTPTSTALEAAWSMTCGCTGAAFNILPGESWEPFANSLPHLRAISRAMPMYTLLSERIGGAQPCGIMTAWHPSDQAAVPENGFRMSGDMYATAARELYDFGLPQAFAPQKAVMSVLAGTAVRKWSEEEIRSTLSGAVYMDAAALDTLNAMGYGEYTGFESVGTIAVDCIERYLPCELNEGIVGGLRNCRQAFNKGPSVAIRPTAATAQPLAELVGYQWEKKADCSMGIFENGLGGRICVGGYYPFTWVSDQQKTLQLKRVFARLCRLPSYVESYARIRNHTFRKENGLCVALLNPTNEPLSDVDLRLEGSIAAARCYGMDGKPAELVPAVQDNGYSSLVLPGIPPYTILLVEAEWA